MRYCVTYQNSRGTIVKVLGTIPIEGHSWSILQDVLHQCQTVKTIPACLYTCAVLYNHLNKAAIYTLINVRQNARGKEMKKGGRSM